MWFGCSGPCPRRPMAGGGRVSGPSSLWKRAGAPRHQWEPSGGQEWRNRLNAQQGLCADVPSLWNRGLVPQLPCPLPVASSWDLLLVLAGGVG